MMCYLKVFVVHVWNDRQSNGLLIGNQLIHSHNVRLFDGLAIDGQYLVADLQNAGQSFLSVLVLHPRNEYAFE